MVQPLFELTAHTQPASWYRDLPQPKRMDASNALWCSNCQQLLGYTWQGKQFGVIVATCYGDWLMEMSKCL